MKITTNTIITHVDISIEVVAEIVVTVVIVHAVQVAIY